MQWVWPSPAFAQTSWGVGILAGAGRGFGSGGGGGAEEALPQSPPVRARSGATFFAAALLRTTGLGAGPAGTRKLQPAEAPRDWAPPQPPHWRPRRWPQGRCFHQRQSSWWLSHFGDDVIRHRRLACIQPPALATAMRATAATAPSANSCGDARQQRGPVDSIRAKRSQTWMPLEHAPYFAVRARS
jgi:hypothetical protein